MAQQGGHSTKTVPLRGATSVVALGLIASLILLAAPTASLVAGFYLDDIADAVEREIDPLGPRGRPLPLSASLYVGLRFAAVSLLVNLAVLALTLFTGVGFAAFFVLNGYLLGREYFELAAMRHLPFPQAVELRRQRSFDVFVAGMIVAGLVAVPLLNLFTPLFATAFMTRMMKRLAWTEDVPLRGGNSVAVRPAEARAARLNK